MAIQKISYMPKTNIKTNPNVLDTNKVNASDMNEIKTVVNNNANMLTNITGDVIWENQSPSTAFGAQTISLDEDLDNYDCYEILYLQSITASRIMTTGKIPVGHGTILNYGTSNFNYRATETTISGTTITFEDGKTGGSTDNNTTIPMYVIAYKTGLF